MGGQDSPAEGGGRGGEREGGSRGEGEGEGEGGVCEELEATSGICGFYGNRLHLHSPSHRFI